MIEEQRKCPQRKLLETTCDLDRVAVIFNPASGTQDPTLRRSALEGLALQEGLACGLIETNRDSGAAPLAAAAVRDGAERVIICGGDGSATEAAQSLAGTHCALALLPGGTGNLLALNLGIPSERAEAMRLALRGTPRTIDVGRANGTVFLLVAGIGADGRMVRDANQAAKRRLGVFAYLVAAIKNIGRQPLRFTVTIDGRRLRRFAQTVMVANMGRITGGMELVPGADPSDGALDVVILRAQRFRHLLALAVRSILGRNRSDRLLEVHRGKHVVIETSVPQPVQIDGNEAGSSLCLEVEIQEGALQVIAPSDVDLSGTPLLNAVTPHLRLTRFAAVVVITTGCGEVLRRSPRVRRTAGRTAMAAAVGVAALAAYSIVVDL